MGKFKKFAGVCILALCLVCLSLGLNFIEPVSQTVALGSAWTYDPEAQTLTYGSVVLENVTASGYDLTIGSNTGFSGALDLSAGVDGYTVVAIGEEAFMQSNITSAILPEGLTTIGDMAFGVCYELAHVDLPDSLETISFGGFFCCSALEQIELPENLQEIGMAAFSASGLKTLTIPENAAFGEGVFNQTQYLESVIINTVFTEPRTFTSNDFLDCLALKNITITNAPASMLLMSSGDLLDGASVLTDIYVPYDRVQEYKSAQGWSDHAEKIKAIPGTEPSPEFYTLTVNGGTGGGEYDAGEQVTVTANDPESGKHFAGWSGAEGLEFTQGSASTATIVFNMPANSVTLTATYANHSGTDDGDCTTAVTCDVCRAVITPAQSEHNWGEWTSNGDGTHSRYCQNDGCTKSESGDCVDDDSDGHCDVCGAELNQLFTVTVTDGENQSLYPYYEGTAVTVTAVGETGKHFKYWSGADGLEFTQGSASTATIVFNMPAQAVTITAIYEDHYGGTATCQHGEICEVCGVEYGSPDPDAHNWSAWTSNGDGTHSRQCLNDGCSEVDAGTCVDGNADGFCDICGGAMNVQQGEKWTYNASAQTLTSPDGKTLNNVTADGTNLTIGSNPDFSGALDLSAGVDGYTVVAIADMAFFNDQGASSLTSVILPEGLETIGQGAFMMAINLSEVVFPESLKTIGLGAFQACMPLSSVTLPQDLEYLGCAAFANTAITELTIPENTQFDTAADESTGMFTYYEQLETLTIESVPASAKTLGAGDFAECPALATLTITNAPAGKFLLEDGALDDLTSLSEIYVNYAYLEDYKTASGWSAYADKIKGIPGTEPSVVTVTVSGGTGGGEYSVGVTVTVTADAPETGKHFAGWSGAEGLTFLDGTSSADVTAKFSMPARSVTLTATYANHSGTDDGDCTTAVTCDVCGEVITPAQSAHNWGEWESNNDGTHSRYCQNEGCEQHMDDNCVDVDGDGYCDTCGYDMRERFDLTVSGGSGSGNYLQGDPATATATGESGKHFVRWEGLEGLTLLEDTTADSETVKFKMPTHAVNLTAVYEAHSGTDDGDCTTEVVCDKCGEVMTPAQSEHNWSDWESNGDGTHSRHCLNPGCEKVETDYCNGGTATCTEHAVCEVCGGEYGDLAEHDYSVLDHDSTGHWYKCSVCGEKNEDSFEEHYGGSAICTHKAVCEVCGEEYGDLAAHTYVMTGNSTEHWEECSVCGVEKPGSREAHSGGTATCEHKAVCKICDREYGELAEHTEEILPYRAPTCTTPGLTEGKRCSVCGKILVAQTEIPVIDHVDEDGDGHCDVCGTDMNKKEYVVTVTGATGGGRYSPGDTVTLTAIVPEGMHFSRWNGFLGCDIVDGTIYTATISFIMPENDMKWQAVSNLHDAFDDGDCTTELVCSVCGAVMKPAESSHNWGAWESNGDGTHSRYCQNEGCEQHEDGDCHGGTATCTHKAVCGVCGGEYGELADHVDKNGDGICDGCGTVLSAVVTVNGGTGGARYDVGATVTVTANTPEAGKHFLRWDGIDGLTLLDGTTAQSKTVKFTMPANAVTLTAVYESHVYTDDCDCTTALVCEVCGEVITPAQSGHNWSAWASNGDGTHSRHCLNPGCNFEETDDCHGGTATCTHKAVCEVCGGEYGDLAAHDYVSKHDGVEHWEECSVCGTEKPGSRAAHSGGSATCQHKAVCGICGEEYGQLGAHEKVTVPGIAATCTTSGLTDGEKCGVCGQIIKAQTVIPALGHKDDNGDGLCDRCGQATVTVKVENGAINGESGTTAVVNKDGSVTVTANAAPSGKAFKGWSVDGGKTIISESAAYTFTASENVTLTAVYEVVSTGGDNTGDNTGGVSNSGGSSGGDNLGGLSGTAVIIIVIACVVVAGVGGFVLCFAIMKRKRDDK